MNMAKKTMVMVRTILWFFVLIFAGLLITLSSISSTYAQRASDGITVAAAISLKDAFSDIGRIFESRTGTRVVFNFGASGILQKQIEGGAPVDVFASAGEKQINELESKGLIIQETRRDFARNTLVLIVPIDSKLNIHSFDDLVNPNLRRLAIGNPKTVPAGEYSRQLLINMKLWEGLQSKLILAEDVRQVLIYVTRGDVDAGMVYASDVFIAQGKVAMRARAPEALHDPILYPIAVIKGSSKGQLARDFVDLILSPDGQNILRKYGFLSIK
ncbi:MAG: molybdate ABC transporter substrate-binding protein [Candidatus Dadabacteria bacterium]